MAKTWTDAEFEVVCGHRIGDRHPTQPRWTYAGVDIHGRALWRRRPLLNRLQLIAAMLLALPFIRAVIYGVAELFDRH